MIPVYVLCGHCFPSPSHGSSRAAAARRDRYPAQAPARYAACGALASARSHSGAIVSSAYGVFCPVSYITRSRSLPALSTPYGLPGLEQGVAMPATRAPIFCCSLEAPCNGCGGAGHGWDRAQPEPCFASLLLHVPAAVPTYQVHFMFFCFFLATTLEPKSQQTVVISKNDHEKAKEFP